MKSGLRALLQWVLLVVGSVFGVLAERAQQQAGRSLAFLIADILGGWAFLVAGMLVWARRPGNRCWWLLMAVGISWFVGTLQPAANEEVSLIGFAFGGWHYLFLVWVLLAFPTGLVPLLRDRILLAVLLSLSTLRTLARLFLFVPPDGSGCDCAPNRFLPITDPTWFDATDTAYIWGNTVTILLALISVALRWRGSSRPGRRMLAPVLAAGTAVLAGLAYDRLTQSYAIVDPLTQQGMFYVLVALRAIAAAAFVFGLWRLKGARSVVAGLVADLGPDDASPAPLGAALRRALGDPTLVLLPWSDAAAAYVDDHEQPVDLPVGDGRRAVTRIERRGVPVAALVHDPALLEDPGLINGVVAAVRLTADNERLRDEVDRQLIEVAASRSRILDAGDAERRRIERDLHDGAQQRLVTIGLALRLTEARLGKDADPQMRSDLVQA
ncbi:MAG: histidine kinase dimerization/phosphoacceptor domain-containing protein, partial [Actinomycetota bacterium]|nr:histidine kinase dimerization/phosphoacceptor domain-containing protein [Actinomycetota bacterium]